ncbi:MAG: chemotaxis protein CheW [Desulfovibrionaceae bacterium]|nr:chemotaxis protein CheW [Desulfovibrionaceae bacterium]MDD4951661.1 chemotaxis protein CheW [Desulfovibrionaceae bacterium]
MRKGIEECVDALQNCVLELESRAAPDASEVISRLGLAHLKLPAPQVITLLDMFADGLTPVNAEIATALLGLCEAHKRLLLALAGLPLRSGPQAGAETEKQPGPEAETPAAKAETEEQALMSGPEVSGPETLEPRTEAPEPRAQASIASVRVPTERLNRLIELVGKLMVGFAVVSQAGINREVSNVAGLRELDAVIGELQSEVDAIRLVPLKQLFTPMHRLVKGLAQKTGKRLRLEIKGEEIALDKSIVEDLNEPLVHLLRNAVDHGLEAPQERLAAGKPEEGLIRISASRKGESAVIEVSDDGRGLDPNAIWAKAVEKGLAAGARRPDDSEVLRLVLRPGFSMAQEVTDLSGRGVGMDAVRSVVKDVLAGELDISGSPGQGARFTLTLPLRRSANEGIVDALVCRAGDGTFIIPSRDVVEIYVPGENEVTELPDGREAVDVRGEVHALLRLGERLGNPASGSGPGAQAVVVRSGEFRAAILVDEVLRQQQVVVTGFTVPVQDIFSLPLAGYGMMGESDALVVDTETLIRTARPRPPGAVRP